MSYSRWLHSTFYTFWNSGSPEDQDNNLFTCFYNLDSHHDFTFKECKEIIKDPNKLQEIIPDINLDQEQELAGYMKKFVSDVENKFANKECENCGNNPCTCKKSDSDFCPNCHSKPCSCDDNI